MKSSLFAVALALISSTGSAEDCLKLVFNKFCLGGDVAHLLATEKPVFDQVIRGDRVLGFGSDPKAGDLIGIVDGRIASINRQLTPATWLTFNDASAALVKLYGDPVDLSVFPSYAREQSSRETAITLGKGRAVQKWDRGEWTVLLAWGKQDLMMLSYRHKALFAQRIESNPRGY